MGALYCRAADMVLLAILDSPKDALSITEIVDALGLLQPTVSMSLTALAESGLVQRKHDDALSRRVTMVGLTPQGKTYIKEIVQQIEDIVVKRKSRTAV
jgi:transcriptional regulator, MarR family